MSESLQAEKVCSGHPALHYSMDLGMDKWFIASGGWILNTLMICGEIGVNLHGEA